MGCLVGFGDDTRAAVSYNCIEEEAKDVYSYMCFDDTGVSISCILISPTAAAMFAAGMTGFYFTFSPVLYGYIRAIQQNHPVRHGIFLFALILEVLAMECTVLIPMTTTLTTHVHSYAFKVWIYASAFVAIGLGITVLQGRLPGQNKHVLVGRMISMIVMLSFMIVAFISRSLWKPMFRIAEYIALTQGIVFGIMIVGNGKIEYDGL